MTMMGVGHLPEFAAHTAESLLGPVFSKLLEIGRQILDLLFVLDAGKNHLGAGDLGSRALDIFGKDRLVPG